MKIIFVSAKVSVFQQDQTTITQGDPTGFTWHFIETKAIKMITTVAQSCEHTKTVSKRLWVVSQQALFFNAF